MPVPPAEPGFTSVQADSGADIPTVNQRVRRVRRIRAEAIPIRYRAISLHACGGVGEVYRAQDAELDREVALKQLQPDGASDPDGQARFIREARITGRLQHPGIIPVYGLVHDSLGRPSYAMRFVEGESLAAAIGRAFAARPSPAEPPPSLRHLLTRFVAVCNAVAYAHSKGVVHRDLKPANVMLGPFGETYVVDWGLAKDKASGGRQPPGSGVGNGPCDLRPPLAENATQQGEVIGTPAFMAPEQAAGRWDEVGPAADIYSLGATLYNLLTGSTPFAGSISDGVLDRVRAGKFVRPCERRSDLPEALEAVCLRAMATAAIDRYPSALDLAAEIERWLADEPVQAFADPWPARLARWGRRRKTLVGSSAAAGIVAVVCLTIATVLLSAANRRELTARELADQQRLATQAEADEVARQRDRVNDRFLLARDAVYAILTSPGLESLRYIPQADAARRQLLETALKFHEEFIRRAAGDPSVREEAALARSQAGDLDYELSHPEAAIKQYRLAIGLLTEIDSVHPAKQHIQSALARIYNNLSLVQTNLRQFDAAEKSLQKCVVLTRALVDADPRPQSPRADLARHYHNIARMQTEKKDFAAAEPSIQASLKLGAELLAEDPKNRVYRLEQSKHHCAYGDLLLVSKRLAEGERELRLSLDLAAGVAKDDPKDSGVQRTVINTQRELGRLLTNAGRPAEAEPLIRAALVHYRAVARDFPSLATSYRDLAQTLRDLGAMLRVAARWDEARAALREAAEMDERAPAVEKSSVWTAIEAAGRLSDFGLNMENERDLPTAIAWYDKAAKMLEDALRREPTNATGQRFLVATYWNRARVRTNIDRYRDAIADWQRVLGMGDDKMRREASYWMAWCNMQLGDAAATAAAVEVALTITSDERRRYDLASLLAVAANLASSRSQEADAYGTRAVAILTAMRTQPILQRPEVRKALATDKMFTALCRRDDFQALLAELHIDRGSEKSSALPTVPSR